MSDHPTITPEPPVDPNYKPFHIPWYVWPLRPILFWIVFITLAVMWPLYTLIGFCLFAWTLKGVAMWKFGEQKTVLGFLLAPLEMFFFLILGSFGMIPIL